MFFFLVKVISIQLKLKEKNQKCNLSFFFQLSKECTKSLRYYGKKSLYQVLPVRNKKIPKKLKIKMILEKNSKVFDKINISFNIANLKSINTSIIESKKANYKLEWKFVFNELDTKMTLLNDLLNDDTRFVPFFYYNEDTKKIRELLGKLILFHQATDQNLFPFVLEVGEKMSEFQKKLHVTLSIITEEKEVNRIKSINNCGLFLFEKILELVKVLKEKEPTKKTNDIKSMPVKKTNNVVKKYAKPNNESMKPTKPNNSQMHNQKIPKKTEQKEENNNHISKKDLIKQKVKKNLIIENNKEVNQKRKNSTMSNPKQKNVILSIFERLNILQNEESEESEVILGDDPDDDFPQSAPVILNGSEREKIKNKKIFYTGNMKEEEEDDWVVLAPKKEFSVEKILNPENEI